MPTRGRIKGQLAVRLGGLDAAIHALESGMGPAWKDTIVAIVTEFGRTARVNGTQGTDHGMATVALLAGGAVKGGRVLADWPGLTEAALYEGRDLKPTRDLRAVLKGVLRDHLGIPDGALGVWHLPRQRLGKGARWSRRLRSKRNGGRLRIRRRIRPAWMERAGYLPSTSTATRATPWAVMPITPAAAFDRSMMRPAT